MFTYYLLFFSSWVHESSHQLDSVHICLHANFQDKPYSVLSPHALCSCYKLEEPFSLQAVQVDRLSVVPAE